MTEYELQKAVCKYLDLKGVLYCGSMGGQYQIFKSQRIKQKLTGYKKGFPDLFLYEDGCFYSKRLNEHIDNINSKSLKAKESVNKRWEKIRTNNDSNTSIVYKSIEDNSKVDKNKVNKRVIEFKNSINQIEGVNNNDKDNFFLYWSELNKSGTKQKFELEKTWDLNRRLKRWSNSSFNKKENGIKFPDYYDIHFAKRIEQDQNATLLYHKHLESIGYIKELNTWNGSSKWIKK